MSTNARVPGTFVMGRGSIKGAMATAAGGVVGALAHSTLAKGDGGLLPKGQIGYLAAHPDRVVLHRAKRGAFKPKPTDEVLAYAPRDQIRGVELEAKALSGVVHVSFSDGDSWTFEVPRVHLRAARGVVEALT